MKELRGCSIIIKAVKDEAYESMQYYVKSKTTVEVEVNVSRPLIAPLIVIRDVSIEGVYRDDCFLDEIDF